MLLEGTAKVVDVGKAAFFRNGGDSERCVNKQLFGFADTELQNVLPGGRVIVGLEQLPQINLADTDALGEMRIGKRGVLDMLVYVFHDKLQQLRGLLFRAGKTVEQIVKNTVFFQLAFITQNQLLQDPKTLDAALRIMHWEYGYFLAIQPCAGEINNREQSFLVVNQGVRAALR